MHSTFSFNARMIPLNVAATSVKLAIPPPIKRALLWPSGFAVAHYKIDETAYINIIIVYKLDFMSDLKNRQMLANATMDEST